MLIDDHPFAREGISRLLTGEPDMRVVGTFGEAGAAVRFAAREVPDVAIVDSAMPEANGADLARRLRAVSPKTRVVLLSMMKQAAAIAAAVRAAHAARPLARDHRRLPPPPSRDKA